MYHFLGCIGKKYKNSIADSFLNLHEDDMVRNTDPVCPVSCDD